MTGHQGRMKLSELRVGPQPKAVPRVRWLGGYRGYGKPDALVDQLSHYLRQNRLTDTVYAMRLERRPRKEFYFFLTFETEYPELLPEDVQERLNECPLLRSAIGPCSEEQVRGFVGNEVKVKALGQCLTYRALRLDAGDDPFAPEVTAESELSDLQTPLGEAARKLLWFLSSVGQGRWSTFQSVCAALGVGDSARRLARTLRLLGHVEFSPGGERWSIVPTQTVRVTDAKGEALPFQVGARLPDSPGESDAQRDGPPRLRLADEKLDSVLIDPAPRLASVLPTLDEYRLSLAQVWGVSSAQHAFARFDGLTFKAVTFSGEEGLYEVTARTGRRMTLLYTGRQWRRGEWYGLRYLHLHAQGLLLAARYDAGSQRLAFPADQRPPLLFERALVLCSGLLPCWQGGWLVYHNVPAGVARQVTACLGLTLEEADIVHAEYSHE